MPGGCSYKQVGQGASPTGEVSAKPWRRGHEPAAKAAQWEDGEGGQREMRSESDGPAGIAKSLALCPGETGFWARLTGTRFWGTFQSP